jgi:hypothetical protein
LINITLIKEAVSKGFYRHIFPLYSFFNQTVTKGF